MAEYDNRGNVSLWKPKSDNPKAPAYSGVAIAHRDIREGEEIAIALWANHSDNEKAPKVTGKLSDRQPKQDAHNEAKSNGYQKDDDFGDSIPF